MKIIHKLSEYTKSLFSKKSSVAIEVNVYKLLNILSSPSHIEKINYKSEIESIKLLKDISKKKFNSIFIAQDLAKILNVNNRSINDKELINLLKRKHNRKATFNLFKINNKYTTIKGVLQQRILKNVKQNPEVIEDLLSNAEAGKLLFKYIDSECLLNHAIECDEDKIVEFLVKKGAPVDMSTLYYCIEYEKFKIFKFLIQIMKNKISIGKKYHELFDHAIIYGRHNIIDKILCDININLVDSKDKTLLHHAVELENLEIVERLIKKGAKLNCVDQNGCTPLNLAIKSRNVEITNLLLDKKAKYNCIHIDNRVLTEEDFEFLWPLAENKGLVLKSEQNIGPGVNQLNTSLTNRYPATVSQQVSNTNLKENDPWVMQEKPNTTLQQASSSSIFTQIISVV